MPDTPNSRRDLWRAVIQQALEDATGKRNDPAAKLERPRARAWFERSNTDFDEVCELAGYEPSQVRKVALAHIAAVDDGLPPGRPLTPRKAEAPTAILEHDGERLTVAQWAKRIGVPKNSLQVRLIRGWTVHRALTTPFATPRTGTARRSLEVSHH